MSTSPNSPRRSPRLNPAKMALSPVELNNAPVLPPPKTPTRRSPKKSSRQSPSSESPIRRSPRLLAKEKLNSSAPLDSVMEFSLPPQQSSELMSSPELLEETAAFENVTIAMSSQANPPTTPKQTPRPYVETDTQMILDGVSVSVSDHPTASREFSQPDLQTSPTKRTFTEVNTPEITITSPIPTRMRPIATPVRQLNPTTPKADSHQNPEQSPAKHVSFQALGISSVSSSPPPRSPSFARPTRASLAHANLPTVACPHESPAKMMRLSHIPPLGPQSSPSRSSRLSSQALPANEGRPSSPPATIRTPMRALKRMTGSPLTRSLSPVRSARKPSLEKSNSDIENILDRIGVELGPIELKELDTRVRSSATPYGREIVELQEKAHVLKSKIEAEPNYSSVPAELEPDLKRYVRNAKAEATKEVLQGELQAAREHLHDRATALSVSRNQYMKRQTLATQKRNLHARVKEYERLVDERPATATKLSDVKAEVESKSNTLADIQNKVNQKAQELEKVDSMCQEKVDTKVLQQSASTENEAAALSRLEQAKSQVGKLVDEFKMKSISWSPAGFVLHHRFLDIVYDRKTKQQKFTLRSENPVFNHFFSLLRKSDPIRANLERWSNALRTYHLLNEVRKLGFNTWIQKGTTLMLKQRIPQGTLEIILNQGLVRVEAKVHDKALETHITDLDSLSSFLKSELSHN